MNIYSKISKKAIRIVTLLTILILLITNIINLINLKDNRDILFLLCQNFVVIILAILLYIFPAKIYLIAIISFQYSISILLTNPRNTMGLLMYFLGISVCLLRGLYKNQRKLKIIITILPLIIIQLSEIRFGLLSAFISMIYKLGTIFVFLLILFFLHAYYKTKNTPTTEEKILNLAKYPTLKKRDAEWLILIQKRMKYDCLAIEYEMSTGSVKNRLKIIFDTLEVGDKTGFLNKYSDYQIVFN